MVYEFPRRDMSVEDGINDHGRVVRSNCVPLLQAEGITLLSELFEADFNQLRSKGLDRDDAVTLRYVLKDHGFRRDRVVDQSA